jgi:hypothetical protein
VTVFFNIEYLRVGGNSNKISSDRAFVTRYVCSIVHGRVCSKSAVFQERPVNTYYHAFLYGSAVEASLTKLVGHVGVFRP